MVSDIPSFPIINASISAPIENLQSIPSTSGEDGRPQGLQQKVHVIALVILGIIIVAGITAALAVGITAIITIFVSLPYILAIGAGVGAALGVGLSVVYVCHLVKQYNQRRMLASQIDEMVFPRPLISSADAIPNNSIYVTKHSAETTQMRLDLIDRAEQSIEICGNFCGGKVFREALDHIKTRMTEKNELKVHLIGHGGLIEKEDQALLAGLKNQFGDRFQFLGVGEHMEFSNALTFLQLHWKVTIVDGQYFVVGGTGLQDQLCGEGHEQVNAGQENCYEKFVYGGCRDMDVIGSGPVAEQLRMRFYQQYALWESLYAPQNPDVLNENRYFELNAQRPIAHTDFFDNDMTNEDSPDELPEIIRNVPIHVTVSGPDDPQNKASLEYIKLIKEVQEGEDITIGNLHFCPEAEVMNELVQATARRVNLTVVTNGIHDKSPCGNTFFSWADRANYLNVSVDHQVIHLNPNEYQDEHLRATKIYEYQVGNTLYHAKAIAAGKKSAIGSFNLGVRSRWDYELTLTFDSEQVTKQIKKVIESNIALSKEVTLEEKWKYHHNGWNNFLGRFQQAVLAPIIG